MFFVAVKISQVKLVRRYFNKYLFTIGELCIFAMMFNIITRKTINEYCNKYHDASNALRKWYYEMHSHSFKYSNELKAVYTSASILPDNRVVFNIGGNKYRLLVRINFQYKAVQVKWFGTHKENDKINVLTIQYKKR